MSKIYYAIKQDLPYYEGTFLINRFTAKKPSEGELDWWEGRGYSLYFGEVKFCFESDVVESDGVEEWKGLSGEERVYRMFNR